MSQQSPWKNIPSSQDDSRTLVNQTGAILVGVFAGIIAVAALGWGVDQFFVLIGRMITITIAAYVAGIAVHFWMSKVYAGGMSSEEIVGVVMWPVGFLRSARRKAKLADAAQSAKQAQYGSEPSVISEEAAKIAGVAVGVLAAILMVAGVFLALASIVTLIGLVLVAYYIGAVVQFWVARSWKDGLTVNELKVALAWPIAAMAYEHNQAQQG